MPAHLAALVFVLEPAFAALFAYVLLGERLGALGWIGGGVMLFAMIIAEVRWPAPRLAGSVADANSTARATGPGAEPRSGV